MAAKKPGDKQQPAPHSAGSLRRHKWNRFLRGPDPELLERLYVPALGQALRYDRCCSYFSSSVLAAAARGFGKLIERLIFLGKKAPRPSVRLVVNEELLAEDVRVLTETGDTSRLEAQLKKRFKNPKDVLEKQRLGMLGWLAKEGYLEVRVGVMRSGGGIVHGKFGIATDATGDAIVFSGSGNESAQGLIANYERLEVSTSWEDPERHRVYIEEFKSLWKDQHPDVHTVTLPEALRLKLIKFAPKEPPILEPSNALARQKAAMLWRFILESAYFPNGGATCDATAMVDLWPHQRRVVEEVSGAWPEGRLLCDEVGLGKTIEAILILRRLMAGRGVHRALILLPAGLVKQWQAEFREKGGMLLPRLDGTTNLVWPDGKTKKVKGLTEALKQDALLLSRETARIEDNRAIILEAEPWDLVLLDEAHAARRGKQEEGEFNSATLLLKLLRELQLRGQARSFLLLSATPMQTQPWEPWDLLAVLGEGGAWLSDFAGVRNYYSTLAAVRQGQCNMHMAQRAATLIGSDANFPPLPGEAINLADPAVVAGRIAFVPPSQREAMAQWLRSGSPLTRRMHRSTRNTLRSYYKMGLLAEVPPYRRVHDIVFDYQDPAERAVYDSISKYITKRYEQLEEEKPGKGFVMTIYSRRASSSPLALERSLMKRREGLRRVAEHKISDWSLSSTEIPEALDPDDLPEGEVTGKVSSALPPDPRQARAELVEVDNLLDSLQLLQNDSKRDKFFEVLRQISEDGRAVLVFTEWTDTLEYLRDNLVAYYTKSLGCFSGDGGQIYNGEKWCPVSKGVITEALNKGEISILLCTDAASEGLNLQAAGAIINYDLPWNPSKVEQRIGRIDRIGQKQPEVLVVNLFLKDSVDDKIYRALRLRCGLFQHFVGAMQPVLARARRMILAQEPLDITKIEDSARQVEKDPLAAEIYIESPPEETKEYQPGLARGHIEEALKYFQEEFGIRVRKLKTAHTYEVAGPGLHKTRLAADLEVLEKDTSFNPLSVHDPILHEASKKLLRPGERIPLVIGSHRKGSFRSSVAYWIGENENIKIATFEELKHRVENWNGIYPRSLSWEQAEYQAKREAKEQIEKLEGRFKELYSRGLALQTAAARLRLIRELGRYLICLAGSASDLNAVLHQQMSRDIATAARLKQCLEKIGGYPGWTPDLRRELEDFFQGVNENQRQARLLGREIDAALKDPRWDVALLMFGS